jgi:pimeloyl-ACP methyl ester carboxylesterase
MSEPRSRMLALGSGRPTVEVVEAGQGPNLFFLHGAGGAGVGGSAAAASLDTSMYAPVLRLREVGARAGAARGSARSLPAQFDVMEALGLEKPLLVGESFGGWIAGEMAALRPREVGKLAVLAPVGLWRDDAPVTDLFGLEIGELLPFLFHDMTSPGAVAMSQLTKLMSDKDDKSDAQVEQLIALLMGFRTAAKFLFPVPETGLERRLWRIRVPTLVLWGAQDRFIAPSYAEIWAKNVKSAQVVQIERCGHLILQEQPEACAKEIQRFAGV